LKGFFKNKGAMLIIFLLLSPMITITFNNNSIWNKTTKDFREPTRDFLLTSNPDLQEVIVFYNTSSYDPSMKTRFEFYGGNFKENEDWNGIFDHFSGFAGLFPSENISDFKQEFPGINIENDEIIQTQMNYVSVQTQSVNSSWSTNGLNGETNSSIAILDTGVDPANLYIQNHLIGWENFVNNNPISDDNGHGTFISSVVSGTGLLPYNAEIPSFINLNDSITHLELFDEFLPAKNYSLKILTFNASKSNSFISINSTSHFKSSEIDSIWFELYHDSILVNSSKHQNSDENLIIFQDLSQSGIGIYDLYIKYHKKSDTNPIFSYNVNCSFFPEVYTQDYNHYTGIANATKILSYKVANQSGRGYVSDLISALGSVIQNRIKFHIVSVCLSLATFGTDITAINRVIDEVIDNDIFVVIAAGNAGVSGVSPLNSIASNERAIVVGAINDRDHISSFSSMGKEISENIIKPDIVAPGGSLLEGHRSVISAGKIPSSATGAYGTSISAAIIAATLNLLIEAKWGTWMNWNNDNLDYWVNYLKAVLLMTASETNLNREDDPSTTINEETYSPSNFMGISSSLKDEHEGYGRVNIESAIDALTKFLNINESISGYLESSKENPLGTHVVARKVALDKNTQYLFNLTNFKGDVEFDVYLFSNNTNQYGEPILLQSTRKWYDNLSYFYFIPKSNETNCVLTIKAIEGRSNFSLIITPVRNDFIPELKIAEIRYVGASKNDTIISLQEFYGNEPLKNYSIDNYFFYIDYFDNDLSNVPPQEVYVHILETSQNYSLFKLDPFDNNFTNGATFRSEAVRFPSSGLYHYYFIASDGNHVVRFPSFEELSILIEFPTDSKQFPYSHNFMNGLDGWIFNGTGWGLLNQSNINDNRSLIYENIWSSIYFGRDHFYPQDYTYQPYIITNPYPNGTLRSPLFNLTQIDNNMTHPFASFGLRVSINTGDFIFLQINLNWTGWFTLKTYTNFENEWFIEKINLTDYIGNFIQFRFLSSLDEQFDPINYKGLMLDYFSLVNYTNYYYPEIEPHIEQDISQFDGFRFSKFTFSCNYYDRDNNYPEFVYVEIGDYNYSMINIYGAWNASDKLAGTKGIFFVRSLPLNEFLNLSFRFHISDGKFTNSSIWFNQDNSVITFQDPTPREFNIYHEGKNIGYNFDEKNSSDFYITGTPKQKESTTWLLGDNSWHTISILNKTYLYGGLGQSFGSINQGYGTNWEINLLTHPLQLSSQYSVYLKFYHDFDLQNEVFLEENLDRCSISISSDFGNSWIILKEFYYDNEDLLGNQSIDISSYFNQVVMFRFTLYTNENVVGIGDGWLISDIYVGYDKETDFIAPNIQILNPSDNARISATILFTATISDNKGLDSSRIYVLLNNKIIDKEMINFNLSTGLLSFLWDTTHQTDGNYKVIVRAYDMEGNLGEATLFVIIENGIFNMRMWGPWIILVIVALGLGIFIYFISEKKGKLGINKRHDLNAEKVRLKYIDKEQIKKRIELFESDDLVGRPLILHCKFCKSWFESKKFNFICPICGHDQIYAAYNCMNCGKWYYKDEPGDYYFCKTKKCEGIKLVRRELEEIKEVLGNKGIYLRKFQQKKKKFSILD